MIKKHFSKELVITIKDSENVENSIDGGFAIANMLMMMFKWEIIAMSLKNIENLHIEIAISRLNQIIKFLLHCTT